EESCRAGGVSRIKSVSAPRPPLSSKESPMRGSCFALVCTSAIFCASVAAADDPYADYRIPAHNWHSWSASANAGGEHSLVRDPGFHGTLGSLNGELSSSYLAGYDSDPSSAFYGLALEASGQRDHRSVELSAPPLSSEDSNRSRHTQQR